MCIRDSSRTKQAPVWLQDFICPTIKSIPAIVVPDTPDTSLSYSLITTTYPLFQTSDLAHLSNAYVASLVSVLNNPESHCYV